MASLDFSVEKEVDKILEIMTRVCKKFGAGSSGDKKKSNCELAEEEGGKDDRKR